MPPPAQQVRHETVTLEERIDGLRGVLALHSSLCTELMLPRRLPPRARPTLRDGSPSTSVDSGLIEIASQAPAPPQLVTRLPRGVRRCERAASPSFRISRSRHRRGCRRPAPAPQGLPSRSQFRQSSGCTIIPTCTKGTCLPATTMSDSSSSLAGSALEHDARDWSQSGLDATARTESRARHVDEPAAIWRGRHAIGQPLRGRTGRRPSEPLPTAIRRPRRGVTRASADRRNTYLGGMRARLIGAPPTPIDRASRPGTSRPQKVFVRNRKSPGQRLGVTLCLG